MLRIPLLRAGKSEKKKALENTLCLTSYAAELAFLSFFLKYEATTEIL
jgi:hypothetical protein